MVSEHEKRAETAEEMVVARSAWYDAANRKELDIMISLRRSTVQLQSGIASLCSMITSIANAVCT